MPSTSCSTEPWPTKPRAASAVLPFPAFAAAVMPGARDTASTTVRSPRARIAAPAPGAAPAGHRRDHRGVAARADRVAVHGRDAGGKLEWCQTEAAAGRARAVERAA